MKKLDVLFMQSQEFFGADSMVHSLLMRYLDRDRINVHVASNHGSAERLPAAYKVLSSIPDLRHRHTRFGPSISYQNRIGAIRELMTSTGAAAVSLSGLVAYCRRHRIDIVHCTEKPRDAILGLLVARAAGARCVIHVHVKAENWLRPQVRWAMRHAEGLIGVSDFVAESLVNLGYEHNRTHVVLNALDLTRWNNQDDGDLDAGGWIGAQDGALRQEFGVGPEIPVLAIVSRLIPWKGHVELIRALSVVKGKVPDFRLLLVGEATYGGDNYTAELRRLTCELGLEQQIVFAGYRRDVPQIMATSDIYSMPSFEEPFGMVYLEAMAMEKPVIALDNGGAREIIEHGKSGLLSAPKDIDQLAANIVELIKAPMLRDRMGKHGRQRVEKFFTPQRMANDMMHVYEQVMARETKLIR